MTAWTAPDEDRYRGYTVAEGRQHLVKQQVLRPLAIKLARAVVWGRIELDRAVWILEYRHMDCPIGIRRTGQWLRDTAREFELSRWSAESAVRSQVWPLCERHAPGQEILAAAGEVQGPLRNEEVLAICRHVAGQALRRRRGGRR